MSHYPFPQEPDDFVSSQALLPSRLVTNDVTRPYQSVANLVQSDWRSLRQLHHQFKFSADRLEVIAQSR
jgi:hypothetical protein